MRATIEDNVVHSPYPAVEMPCCSFYDAAKKALLIDPDKLALADGTVEMTRLELFKLMQRYAAGFQKHGLEPGDRVCVHVGTSVESFAAMWGCVFAGASIVLAKTSLTERELRYQLSDSDCTHVLTEPAFAEKTAKAVASLPIKGLFSMGPAEGFVSTVAFRDLDEALFREVPIQDPREYVLFISYTSGTTGLPKGAVGTHYDYVGNTVIERPCFTWDESDIVLIGSPIAHASGFICTAVSVLLGITTVMTSPGTSLQRISELVAKYKVTAVSFLQMHLKMLVSEMHKTGNRLPGVRRVGIAGNVFTEAARRTVEAAFSDLECLANAYAMTESIGVICAPPIEDAPGTDVGFPAPWSKIKVVDRVTREKLGPNQIGEICFRTPTMMKQYYKRPKETAELFDEDGWCKSGDAGYYDEDGRLYVVQRLKELIKCMDNQVVPAELEDLILQEHSEYISEVVVVGLPHSEYGEAPAAAVVLKDFSGSKCDPAQLAKKIKATITDNLAVHKNLYGGVFVFDSLPKTETGKISRHSLAQVCVGRTAL